MRCRRAERRRSRSGSPEASRSEVDRAVQVSASTARSPTTQHRSGRFHSVGPHGYAAAEWSGSTWRFQVRLQHPLESPPSRPLNPTSDPYRTGSKLPHAKLTTHPELEWVG